MLNKLIYADIKANSSGGGGGSDDEWFPPDPPDLPGYNPYDEDGEWSEDGELSVDDGPVIEEDYLYGESGRLIYSSNLAILLRWNFSMSGENIFPVALVDGEEVCKQHSSGHIVVLEIDKTSGIVRVRMSLKSSGEDCNWNGEASCLYSVSCKGTSLEKEGTCRSGASFRVSIKASGEVSIS